MFQTIPINHHVRVSSDAAASNFRRILNFPSQIHNLSFESGFLIVDLRHKLIDNYFINSVMIELSL